jgi:hypothetical protein
MPFFGSSWDEEVSPDSKDLEEYRWLCKTVAEDHGSVLLKLSTMVSSGFVTAEQKLTLSQAIKKLRGFE